MKTTGKIINVLGDSITEGANATRFECAYHQILQKICGFSRVNVYGVGGTRIAKQTVPSENQVYDRDFCSRADDMDRTADIVMVFGGTNDYGHGDAPLGDVNDRLNDTFCGCCYHLFKNLRDFYPKSDIIVVLPLRRLDDENPYGEQGKKSIAMGTLSDYAERIRQIAVKFAFPVCDLRAEEQLNPNVKVSAERYFTDGLHPNDAGHALLAEKIANFLAEI